MRVTETLPHPSLVNHQMQIGISTWTQNNATADQSVSIRRAVYNTNGIFSPHGSSEIPIEDMGLLMRACINRDLISPQEMSEIMGDIIASIQRRQ